MYLYYSEGTSDTLLKNRFSIKIHPRSKIVNSLFVPRGTTNTKG